jgi:hypothetical protein
MHKRYSIRSRNIKNIIILEVIKMVDISWWIKTTNIDNEEMYIPAEDYYLGTFYPKDIVKIEMQIWNNKSGTTETEEVKSPTFVVYFNNAYNLSLLKNTTITINDIVKTTTEAKIENNKLKVLLCDSLTGTSVNTPNRPNNFASVKIEILTDANAANGLNDIFFDLETI